MIVYLVNSENKHTQRQNSGNELNMFDKSCDHKKILRFEQCGIPAVNNVQVQINYACYKVNIRLIVSLNSKGRNIPLEAKSNLHPMICVSVAIAAEY